MKALLPYMPGHGYCSCGRCICQDGWFGKLCQFPRSCDMSDTQSRELCETSDGVSCSGKGERDFGSLHFSRAGINLWKCRNLIFIRMLNVNNLWVLEIILSYFRKYNSHPPSDTVNAHSGREWNFLLQWIICVPFFGPDSASLVQLQ